MNEDHRTSPAGVPPVVRVAGLAWGVGGLVIIDDVSLDVAEGEFLSVIGPNGAGKTSLINLISGVHRPTGGSILVRGREVTGLRPAARVGLGIGRTFQASSLFPVLTVHENVRIAAQAALGGSLHLLRRPRPGDDAHRITGEVLERVGLTARADTRAGSLSHGDKRKVELAMVLAADPSVLLLDEPTAGVSVEETRPLVDLIRQVHQDGKTVVMVEHRMEFVVDVSDRIAVMHQGKMLIVGTPEEVMSDRTVRTAYLGTEGT
ncbi:MAG: ABC transporter ATP-binding protein [Acidimicrobiia bacterium]|nr:ABC transporter ATP-binding protein [Acidimicrobiia bacterium]